MANARNYLIGLDAGHGLNTIGKETPVVPEYGRKIKEFEFNIAVTRLLDIELKRIGFRTVRTDSGTSDVSLVSRTNKLNAARTHLNISNHFNAFLGKWGTHGGFSAHVQPTHNKRTDSVRFAGLLLKHIDRDSKYGMNNRGMVNQNLHMTREAHAPTVLFEHGFMDNRREALLMLDAAFHKSRAVAMTKSICEYFGVKYYSEPTTVKPTAVGAVDHSKGIGIVEVTTPALNLRAGKDLNSSVKGVLSQGDKFYVYKKDGKWYDLGEGFASEGSAANLLKFTPHPEPPKKELYRVVADGEQLGAYGEVSNVLAAVERAHKDKAKVIVVSKV